MVGGEVYEKWTCDLAGVSDRPRAAVSVYVFAVGLGFATVLGLVLTPMACHWGEVKETHRWFWSMVSIILVNVKGIVSRAL